MQIFPTLEIFYQYCMTTITDAHLIVYHMALSIALTFLVSDMRVPRICPMSFPVYINYVMTVLGDSASDTFLMSVLECKQRH